MASLAAVDSEGKLNRCWILSLPYLWTGHDYCGNLIANVATIAGRPLLGGGHCVRVLKVERAEDETAECRNVAIGHVIESFD